MKFLRARTVALMLFAALVGTARADVVMDWNARADAIATDKRLLPPVHGRAEIVAVGPAGVTLKSGEEIAAATVVWCAGMRANPLTRLFSVEHDRFGRIPVDAFMRVKGVDNVFAAGDVAWAMMDDRHA